MSESVKYNLDNQKVFNRKCSFILNAANDLKKEINEDGFLIQYDVPIARTGEFIYKAFEFAFVKKDGIDPNTSLKVFRDKDAFSPEILAKNKDVPFTNDHPNGAVNTENAKRTIVGGVHDLYMDGNTLYAGRIVVHDSNTIADIEQKGKKEVSIGFEASYDLTPQNINGTYYDGREEVIRINHLSLVNAGKAGPEFKMHTKPEDNTMSQPETVKVTINGVELDVPADKAIALNQAESQDRFKNLSESVNSLTEQFNSLMASLNDKKESKEEEKKEDDKDAKKDDKKESSKEDKKEDKSENECEYAKNKEDVKHAPDGDVKHPKKEGVQKNSFSANEYTSAPTSDSFMCNSSKILSPENIASYDFSEVFAAVQNTYNS